MRRATAAVPWLVPLSIIFLATTIRVIVATRYIAQIISIMGDTTVEWDAANYLYRKNPGVSTITKWNNAKKAFDYEEGYLPDTSDLDYSNFRIQVVGHGDVKGLTLSGKSPSEIAAALDTLYPKESRVPGKNTISRVSLVCCNCGYEGADAGESFSGNLLTHLKESYSIDTSVTARNTLVVVDSTGKKLTSTMSGDDKIVWKNKDPTAKKVYTLDDKNNVISESVAYEGDPITCTLCGFESYGLVIDDVTHTGGAEQSIARYSARTGERKCAAKIRLSPEALYGLIDKATRSLFDNARQNENDEWIRTAEEQRMIVRERVGNAATNKERNVRIIRDINDLTNEINYFGRGGKVPEEQYYRFGAFVCKMRPEDFYINSGEGGYMGIVINDQIPKNEPSPMSENRVEQLSSGKTNANLAYENIPLVGENYVHMPPDRVSDNFMKELAAFMYGDLIHPPSSFDGGQKTDAKATNAQRSLAMTLSESIRNFRTHIANMIGVDLYKKNKHIETEDFISKHPMATGGSWIKLGKNNKPIGYEGSLGDRTLEDLDNDESLTQSQRTEARNVRTKMSNFVGTWLSKLNAGKVRLKLLNGEHYLEQKAPPENNPRIQNIERVTGEGLHKTVEEIANAVSESLLTLQQNSEYDISPDIIMEKPRELASVEEINTPETEVVNQDVEQLVETDSRALPVAASKTLEGDQEAIAHQMTDRIEEQSKQDGKEYNIVEKSVEQEENEINFKVTDSSEPPEEKQLKVKVDEEKIGTDDVVKDLDGRVSEYKKPVSKFQKKVRQVGETQAIAGTVRGLFLALGALEDGNIKDGLIGLTQTLFGIGSIVGINKAVYKSAGRTLSKVYKGATKKVAKDISVNPEFMKETSEGERALKSSLGEEKIRGENVPFVGIMFGIYNIKQDFDRHSLIGYIDAALDIAITGLDVIAAFTGEVGEPFIAPIAVALNAIRMFIDDFYYTIQGELDKLPPGASTGQKVGAFFKGFGKATFNIMLQMSVPGQISLALYHSYKLNQEYEQDQELLRNLSNYDNYFLVEKEEGTNVEEINFADGTASWNGGNIVFHLMDGDYFHLQMNETIDKDGNQKALDEDFPRDPNLQDIVMGIGESHSVTFKTEKAKIFWFIPVDTKRVITSLDPDNSSLHGTYYGNSQNNRFFAVQQQPPDLGYNLSNYSYQLFGGGGNDTFYLGPQYSYVEGNDGADAYYISENSTHTDINNFARDQMTDSLVTTTEFSALQLSKSGQDLLLKSHEDGHNITIYNWFRGVLYQHMEFTSGDGFLFWITVTKRGEAVFDPYAWSKSDSTERVTLDLSRRGLPYENVITLIGSNFSDTLIGNDQNNQINGLGGDNFMRGGEGMDTYLIEDTHGANVIYNFALDDMQDFIFFNANCTDISAEVQGDNIAIFNQDRSLSVTINSWFVNSSYQHLLIASNDSVVMSISNNASSTELLRELFVDMELMQGPKVLNMSDDEISVIGSDEDDTIQGNANSNYFEPGLGDDYVRGGEGQDTYIIRPGDGRDTVNNYAVDELQDTILFGVGYEEVALTTNGDSLVVYSVVDSEVVSVQLLDWFKGESYQHLLVRSIDGVVFAVTNITFSETGFTGIKKTPLFVDAGQMNSSLKLDLNKSPWENMTRVSGSKVENAVSGNEGDTVIDPGEGQAFLRGRNGKDTYVIQANYSHGNRIHNTAEDQVRDTLVFEVPYSHIAVQKQDCSIELSSNLTSGDASVLLVDFMLSPKEQHLLITSSDGISFILPEENDYQPVPLLINVAREQQGQSVNLTVEQNFSTILTVFGSMTASNYLVGNKQNNSLLGGGEADSLFGEEGNDVLKGDNGNDALHGGPGDDILDGGSGDDMLYGENGDDILVPGTGVDGIDGGNGSDTILCTGTPITASGSHIDLGKKVARCNNNSAIILHSIENAYGSAYNDTIIDSTENNRMVGSVGNDTFVVTEGYDVMNGGPGYDTYDLRNANGTKVIMNFANDSRLDVILMSYVNKTSIRYRRSDFDLVVRVTLLGYPNTYYNGTYPTVILSGWYLGNEYRHIEFVTYDGVETLDVIEEYASHLTAYNYQELFGDQQYYNLL